MNFNFDDAVDHAEDHVGEHSSTVVTETVTRRPGHGGRMVVVVTTVAAAVMMAVLVGVVGAATASGGDGHDHDDTPGHGGHDHDDTPDHDDRLSYVSQSAAAEPPLPGVQPAGTFDPEVSVANYDASVVASVVDDALVFTESGGPINRHWADLPPGFELRALSIGGTQAALVHHRTDGSGRVTGSDIVVAERPPSDSVAPVTVTLHHLDGLVEPEAFATDGRSLYVIDHQAGSEPGTYRIRPFNLETGELEEMLGPSKTPLIEDMNGSGRRQVWGLGDGRLYTLYIRQTDHVHASGRPGSDGFVHILDLDEEWAFCLDLPSAFGQGDLQNTALAVGATRLAVLDLHAGEGGQMAYASTADRRVTEVIDLPLSFRRTMKAMLVDAAQQPGRPAGWKPPVHLAMNGPAIAVGVGDAVVWFDGATLEPVAADSDSAHDHRVELDGTLVGLTTVPGNGVLAWTVGGQGPEQLTPPRTGS